MHNTVAQETHMNKHLTTLVTGLVIAVTAPHAAAQTSPAIGGAPLTRIGVVVRDVNKAVKVYADIFQLSATPAVASVKIDLPKGSAKVKRAVVTLPNTRIEIDQPEGTSGPAADYLSKYGQGIYRVGFSTPDPIEPKVVTLEQKGGKLTAGSRTGTFAWVDLTPMLGTTIEIQQEAVPALASAVPAAPIGDKVVLGTTPMSHLGWAVTNADQVAKNFSDVFGIGMPTVRDFKQVEFPPNYPADPTATLRLTSFKQANAGIELIQSLGQTNWADFVSRHGTNSAPQHLAFPVGDKLEQTTHLFQSKGAAWTNGKVGGTYEYLDFTETLGIIFELNGTWGPQPAK
jgi:hypothetical protein